MIACPNKQEASASFDAFPHTASKSCFGITSLLQSWKLTVGFWSTTFFLGKLPVHFN